MKKVYVAGASAEIARAMSAMAGISVSRNLSVTSVTCDWTDEFRDIRVPEAELCPRLRRQIVERDLRAVLHADFLWFLAPAPEHATKGAWAELGGATVAGMLLGGPAPRIVVSGKDRFQSVFTEAAHEFFETDADALEWLRGQV